MSFIFSRALVEASSPASFGETDASAQSSESPTLKPCLWHDKTTERFPLSRFGMTCSPLTETRGEELLTWWRADFLVRTSAQPELAQESMASAADYGQPWRGSFAKFDPSESKWKTAQCSLLEDSGEFSGTWPRWGSMLNGECFLRQIPALPICESASGYSERFPTPIRNDAEKRGNFDPVRSYGLAGHVKIWQTPVADDAVQRIRGKWNSRGEPKAEPEASFHDRLRWGNRTREMNDRTDSQDSQAALLASQPAAPAQSEPVATFNMYPNEGRILASILRGMVEGGSGDPAVIYEDAYSAADGDVYVARAAELLDHFATPQPAQTERAQAVEQTLTDALIGVAAKYIQTAYLRDFTVEVRALQPAQKAEGNGNG